MAGNMLKDIIFNVFILLVLGTALYAEAHPCSRGKRCVMPECDHMESLSMCAPGDAPCPENHDEVYGKTICTESGRKCCRSYCHGHGSICWLKMNKCPEGFADDPFGTCKVPDYRCCAPLVKNMTAPFNPS